MKKFLLFSACVLGLAACGGGSDAESDPNVLMHTDFESVDGWLPGEQNGGSLNREKAHSGKTSIKVDGTHEFSLSFSKPFGQLHESRPKKLKISAWTFVPDAQSLASIIVSISDPSAPDAKPVLWEALDLGKESKPFGEWKEVSKVITVPANVGPNNKLGIYMWRNSGTKAVYADDFKVTLAD